MTHVEQALVDLLLDRIGQVEQTQQVTHGGARAPHRIRNLLMCKVKFLDQAHESLRFLEWIQVFALDVFDQRDGRRRFCIEFAHHRRNLLQPGQLRRAPAPLTGDQLEMIAFGAHHDRLHHTLAADRIGQFLQGFRLENLARLIATALDAIDIDFASGHRMASAVCCASATSSILPISEPRPRPRRFFFIVLID